MPDIIHLLPESVANQIAAGEVVQRPASVVKELLENALDAGANSIRLVVKESGKTLIQIVDDGSGMSETDARMSFERHATSKIMKAQDLFSIKTMGFRGEALASIASVATVEMKTKRREDTTGILLMIEGGELTRNEPIACPDGTSVSVRNLFFNIPVRKNFLKSNSVEYHHIVDEFLHTSIAFPEIRFIMTSENAEVYHLAKSSLRLRLINIFGKKYESLLILVEENTPIVKIRGYIGKPETARKTRGDQFLYVNNRFIRNPFFNHAIASAFDKLLPAGYHPFYVLFLELPYNKVDVNVHPTKTEVKFEDEKEIYMIVKAAAKKALGQHHLSPTLDFEHESFLNNLKEIQSDNKKEEFKVKVAYGNSQPTGNIRNEGYKKANESEWKELLRILNTEIDDKKTNKPTSVTLSPEFNLPDSEFDESLNVTDNKLIQIHNKYIFTSIHSGIMLIHQQFAHQRILFEEYLQDFKSMEHPSQKQIFPDVIEFSETDFQQMKELIKYLEPAGFIIEDFGKRTLVISGVPASLKISNIKEFIEDMLEEFKNNLGTSDLDITQNLAISMAVQASVKVGDILSKDEMSLMVDKLFACENPYYSPKGKPVFMKIEKSELDKKFE